MILRGVVSYPVPPYANVPIEPEFYKPRQFLISNVTLGYTTTVTTSDDMDYVVGQEVRLIIPAQYGCFQLNGKTGYVLSIPADNQVEISINSILNVNAYIAYVYPTAPSGAQTFARILAIGDINMGATNSHGRFHTKTYIPGSFRNISPHR